MQQRIKILAIDSKEIILKSIRKALCKDKETEYSVTLCETAIDGLRLIRNDTYDLILLDLVMPGINGIELLRRIKKINQKIPIVILSGYSSKSSYSDVISSGAKSILLKPFSTTELKSVISGIINIKNSTNNSRIKNRN